MLRAVDALLSMPRGRKSGSGGFGLDVKTTLNETTGGDMTASFWRSMAKAGGTHTESDQTTDLGKTVSRPLILHALIAACQYVRKGN
mmetsp:Transcript_22838/g.52883  ORF Transcript_22838/g.52883 Transcript_22838/m.52883 type:complete len:87 (+) Transcript_22838:220-480(+)